MPKKFAGENSKAAIARSRKETAKETEKLKKKQQEEDALWQDNDKNLLKKQQKKEDLERKKQEQLQKKAEAKALLEQEMMSIKKSTKSTLPTKLSRAQIEQNKIQATKKEVKKIESHLDIPIEENVNRLVIDGDEARSITDAIQILSTKDEPIDKHPEKRMKAAYKAFEERRLAEMKSENANLKLSQLKQMIFKEWQKSPENPLNAI